MEKTKFDHIPKLLGILALILILFTGCSKENLKPDIQQKQLKSSGTDHGYFWLLYYAGGTASISFPNANQEAGNFAITYNNVSELIGGKGWSTGAARTIGYKINYVSGNYNFIGIYGWTTNPLIEYYVCEKGSLVSGTYINSVSSDGHTYNFYRKQLVNQPSIQGTQTFWEYIDQWGGASIGSMNYVTMANHINNWEHYGGHDFGSYSLQILALEAFGNKSGYIYATVW